MTNSVRYDRRVAPPYSTFAVANRFLDVAEESGSSIDPMKLQKLVYYAHGWHLGLNGEPLIDEMVEAWPYGPVISSLYHEFKEFGNNPIDDRAENFEAYKEGNRVKVRSWRPRLEDESPDYEYADRLIRKVWEKYGGLSSIQLSNMTHRPDTPWKMRVDEYQGRPPRGLDIPNDMIREYFHGRLRRKS